MSKKGFEKFINKEVKGAKKKEAIRQEKKQYNREKRAFFEEQKRLKRLQEQGGYAEAPRYKKRDEIKAETSQDKKAYYKKDKPGDQRKSADKKYPKPKYEKHPVKEDPINKKPFAKKSDHGQERTDRLDKRKYDFRKNDSIEKSDSRNTDRPRKQITVQDKKETVYRDKNQVVNAKALPVKKDAEKADRKHKPVNDREQQRTDSLDKRKDAFRKKDNIEKNDSRNSVISRKQIAFKNKNDHGYKDSKRVADAKPLAAKKSPEKSDRKDKQEAEKMPLNKYLAHAGVCARREAAELIKTGLVKVNNAIITEPGYKVLPDDNISFKGKKLQLQHRLVYVLLNKPKDYITTSKDPEGRKTVFELVHNATDERIYPVGRLDRNTTGVLLFTNDGELAQRLTHPSFQVRKIYEVKLNKVFTKEDFQKLSKGLTLDDGFIQPDALGYADTTDKTRIGIEIHSGRNRIVRRMFEQLGYDVRNLDRVLFANLTKKNIERGHWRHLNDKEVRLLKYMNKSFIKKETN